MAIEVSPSIVVPDEEIEIQAMRAQGPGGQNVNKVAAAVHLRFDIARSSLPDWLKQRLMALGDHRITSEGVVVIKAQQFRSQVKNRDDARERLAALIRKAAAKRKPRKPTRPTKGSKERRLQKKAQRGRTKSLRGPVV